MGLEPAMILRMYELAAADFERLTGWPANAGAYAAPLGPGWPRDRVAVELAVTTADARGRPLSDADRGSTIRRLIPWLVRRLVPAAPDRQLLVRLDGRMERGGLADALRHLPNAVPGGIFALSGATRCSDADPPPPAWATMVLDVAGLVDLCADPALRLDRAVRLRLWVVPAAVALSVIAATSDDPDAWPGVHAESTLFLTTSANLQSLFVVGPADAEELRHALLSEAVV